MVLKTITSLTFVILFTWSAFALQVAPSAASGAAALTGATAPTKIDSAKTSQASKDSLLAQGQQGNKSRVDSIKVVKHNFNHREQIITGSVVMICFALVLVTMNNYNPR